MAENENKTKIKLDPNAPISAEELREHEVVEHLLKTHPELQEKSEVTSALGEGVSKFKFGKWDFLGSLTFGAVFGTALWGVTSIVGPGLEGLATTVGIPLLGEAGHFIGGIGALGGWALAAKSAVGHTVGEACKGFYDKCKDGYAEAKQHNEAVQFLKKRVTAIKMYKQKHFMKGIMENPEGMIQGFQPQTETAQPEYEHQRARVVDTILAEKKKHIPELSWVQRTEAQTAPNQSPSL